MNTEKVVPYDILELMNRWRELEWIERRTGIANPEKISLEQFLRKFGYLDDHGVLLPLEIK
jgi:hypothetical protein